MKTLLTIPPCFYLSGSKWTPPTGLLYLAASLEQSGDSEIEILDPIIENLSFNEFINRIIRSSPNVVGLSVTSDAYFDAVKACRELKRRKPETTIILGGPHPTLLGEAILERVPQADIIVRGEGETALPGIINRIRANRSLEGLPNTSWRANGKIVRNKETQVRENLDEIPFPAMHLIDYQRYNLTYPVESLGEVAAVNIISSRGCPFNCMFCANTNLSGRRVRMRSIENVIEEIKLRLGQYGVRYFSFQDDAFNLSVSRLMRFCDALEREKLSIHFSCAMRADNANEEIISRMKEVGLAHVFFSIEHIDDHIRQDILGKALPKKNIDEALNALERTDVPYSVAFMISLPDEDTRQMEMNMRYIEDIKLGHPQSRVNLNLTKIYPGTRLEQEALNRKVLHPDFDWLDLGSVRRKSPGVLVGLTGEIPLYKEKLTYRQMFSCLFRWRRLTYYSADPQKNNNLIVLAWLYLRSIKYFRDAVLLFHVGCAWLSVTFKRLSRSLTDYFDSILRSIK
ncbi:MAG: radical SAM protein [Thermodesulfobacteriota bacterium]